MLTSDDLVGLLRTIARLSNEAEELRRQRDVAVNVGRWLIAESIWREKKGDAS